MPHGEARSGGGRVPDHLSNERTFLAWVRTAIGFVALGLVVHRLSVLLGASGRPAASEALVGGAVAALGGLVSVFALARFLRVRRQIRRGHAEPDPWLAVATGLAALLAAALVAALILRA